MVYLSLVYSTFRESNSSLSLDLKLKLDKQSDVKTAGWYSSAAARSAVKAWQNIQGVDH